MAAGKIFYRERPKMADGAEEPRFELVATWDLDMRFHETHVRKSELEQLAKVTGAELVHLAMGPTPGQKQLKSAGGGGH